MGYFCDIRVPWICLQFVIVIFTDNTYYFWHKGFIYKLKRAGTNGLLLDWLSDYLTSRKQRFAIPGGKV